MKQESGVRKISVAARGSPLSRAQVVEVLEEIRKLSPEITFAPVWITTSGDKDLLSSLRDKEKTDFFTKEVDEAVVEGVCRIGIHSAKDLPDPLHNELCVVAYTRGVDPSDVIIFREGESLRTLPSAPVIGTSSMRRMSNVKEVIPDAVFFDVRGTIADRLSLLDSGKIDGLVVAEAALLRLQIVRTRVLLPGPVSPLQGRLAVTARKEDREMIEIFSGIDYSKETI